MTNDERSTETQRRINEIETILVQMKAPRDEQLAACHPAPETPAMQMCRIEELESDLRRLQGPQQEPAD